MTIKPGARVKTTSWGQYMCPASDCTFILRRRPEDGAVTCDNGRCEYHGVWLRSPVVELEVIET